MSLSVRREVVLSSWEIHLTRLRAESAQPPACSWKTSEVKRMPFLVTSVACVVERSFEGFAVRQLLSRGRRRA